MCTAVGSSTKAFHAERQDFLPKVSAYGGIADVHSRIRANVLKISKCIRKLNLLSSPPKTPIYTPRILPSNQAPGFCPCAASPAVPALCWFQTEAVTHSDRDSSPPSELTESKASPQNKPPSLPPLLAERQASPKSDSTCLFFEWDLYAPTSYLNKPLQKSMCVYRIQHNGQIGHVVPQGIKIASNVKAMCFHRLQSGLTIHAHLISCFQFTIRFYV